MLVTTAGCRGRCGAWVVAAMVATMIVSAAIAVTAQDVFQFVIAVVDGEGRPVTDLAPDEIVVTENDVANQVLELQPFRVPVRLTIAVDNGPLSGDALAHYRTGLRAMVERLPEEIEVTVISTAPQPRMVVQPTTDRERILRGINGFAPERESPRFTDALVEFARRLERDFENTGRIDFIPVLLLVSTTASEAVSYEAQDIERAIGFLAVRKAKVHVTLTTQRQDAEGLSQINTNRQALIARPAVEMTGGRFEALATSNRLTTLLPEIGDEIATLHIRHSNQALVTVRRQPGLSGPLQNPQIGITRSGLTGLVSLDGLPSP